MIPYGRQDIQDSDVDAVLSVLQSDFLTQGPAVPRFEQAVSKHCGARHAVAVNSATSALHIALMALDVTPGDVVWTSPNTFVASSNAALYCGASVDFVDIDIFTYNMCAQKLKNKLEETKISGGKMPKVVIPVHFAGSIAFFAQNEIKEVGEEMGFKVGNFERRPIDGLVPFHTKDL